MPSRKEKTPPTVRVTLPLLEDEGGALKPDQTEQVVINGNVTSIRRGESVDVKIPVFLQLKRKYPFL